MMEKKGSHNDAFPMRDHVSGDVIKGTNAVKVTYVHGNIFIGGNEPNQSAYEDYASFLNSLKEKGKKVLKENETRSIKGVLKELNGVTTVPLQITVHAERHYTDDVDYYTHRDELVRKSPIGDIRYKELFKEARSYAENKLKAKKSQLDIKGNIVSISGQAGIGKTTLMKVILYEVIETCLYGSKIVFYLQFDEVDFKRKTSLLQLLAKSVDCLWMNDGNKRKSVMEKLLNRSEEVLIIMDGLDEADINWKSISTTKVSIYREEKPEVLIANILNGNIFPNAKKLLTSRPRQLSELPDRLRPGFSVRILGLNKNAQKQICDEICENNSQKVFDYIQDHPDLSSYCFVPVHCMLVIHYVNKLMQHQSNSSTKISLHTSMTMILTLVLGSFIETEQMRENELQTKELSHLAWQGFSAQKLTFNEKDLRKADLNEATLSTFFMTIRGESELPLLGGDSVSYFSPLLLEKFFFALHLLFFIDFKKFNSLFFESTDGNSLFNLNESRFEMVLKFLFGLCNKTTIQYLQKLIFKCSFPSQKAEKLKDWAYYKLQKLVDLTDQSKKFRSILRICSLAYEMQNKEFTEEVASSIKDHISVRGDILTSDVTCLFYVLKASKELLEMDVESSVSFHGDSSERFSEEMKKTLELRKIEMRRFHLSGFEEKDMFHWAPVVRNIQELVLVGCNITVESIKRLSEEISKLDQPMKLLDLSCNKIGDEGGIRLKEIVNNVESLNLGECNLTAVTVESIAMNFKSSMKLLDLSCNKIGDEGGIHLKEIVNNVESLDLSACNLSGVTVKSIATSLKKPMKCLRIERNKIGNTGFIAISPCLSKIAELCIGDKHDKSLTMEGINSLSSALQGLENPMEKLELYCSRSIRDEVRKELQKCQSNVKYTMFWQEILLHF